MRIKRKSVTLNVENDITTGHGAIKFTATYQICVYKEDNGELEWDVDVMDFKNVTFMGMPISDDLESFEKFKIKMAELGVDVDMMINEACCGIVDEAYVHELIADFKIF